MADIFDDVFGANESGGGDYLGDGKYKLVLSRLWTEKGHKGMAGKLEARVLRATPVRCLDINGDEVKCIVSPVGSTAAKIHNFAHESSAGNFKTILMTCFAALGIDRKAVTPEKMREFCESNKFKGVVLYADSYRHVTKAKKVITLHKWSAEPQTIEQVVAQRALLTMDDDALIAYLAGAPAGASTSPVAPAQVESVSIDDLL